MSSPGKILGEPVVVVDLFEVNAEIIDVQLLACFAIRNDWTETRNADDFHVSPLGLSLAHAHDVYQDASLAAYGLGLKAWPIGTRRRPMRMPSVSWAGNGSLVGALGTKRCQIGPEHCFQK